MKHKTSVSFDEKTIEAIRELIRSRYFRNKSHVVEYAVHKLIDEIKNNNSEGK
ncbi:ribbon-helix-helix domain-containing protein [Nanoarchaeota archaeon]